MAKIRFYSPWFLADLEKMKFSKTKEYVEGKKLLDALGWVDDSLMDRTGYFWQYLNLDASPLPPIPTEAINLHDIITNEAKKYDRYNEIYVLWSGGIDSTALLVALMKTIKPEKITILCSDLSIAEYPWFYETFKDSYNFEVLDRSTNLYDYLGEFRSKDDYIVISGYVGDHLFGVSSMLSEFPHLAKIKWQDAIRDEGFAFKHTQMSQGTNYSPTNLKDLTIRKMEAHIDNFGINITSLDRLCWWILFAFAFDRKAFSWINDKRTYAIKTDAFYAHDEFQAWPLYVYHHDLLDFESIAHKMPLKDYIYEFTGDREYRDTKLKEGSMPKSYQWGEENNQYSYKLVDDEGVRIEADRVIQGADLQRTYSRYLNIEKLFSG